MFNVFRMSVLSCQPKFVMMGEGEVVCMGEVARMDISGSEHVLWTDPTPSRTNWAPYLSRAGQIRLRAIFLSYNHIKYKL